MNEPRSQLPPLRDVIKSHGLSASKALGQNFLLDEHLLDRIAAIPGSLAGKHVYEVGPGPGGLTRALLRAGANVTAVERDHRCLPILASLFDAFPGQLRIIEDDAMRVDPVKEIGEPFHIVSNLPYNVGTALAVGWLSASDWPPPWLSMTLMFQREVADRIVAPAGNDSFGRLSVLSQWRSTAKLAMPVHRSAFTPPPKIMSAIVHFTPAEQPAGTQMSTLEKLTAAAFGQRRKMLRQSLKGISGALEALQAAEIPADRRPETLEIAEWVALARAMDRVN